MKLDRLTMSGTFDMAAANSGVSAIVNTGFVSLTMSTSISPPRAAAARLIMSRKFAWRLCGMAPAGSGLNSTPPARPMLPAR